MGLTAAYFLAKKFEPEVRDAVVYELNRHLSVPVEVEDINLSLIQRFPYASLRFSNVVVPETGKTEPDTLIFIHDLYLQIGLLDFFRKNYSVSEAEINRGFFRMEILGVGQNNYKFWKTSKDSSGSTLTIKDIEINDFTYQLSTYEGLEMEIEVIEGRANGNFGEDVFSLESRVDLIARSIGYADQKLYRDLAVAGNVTLLIDGKNRRYEFDSPSIAMGKEDFALLGTYVDSGDDPVWEVNLRSERTDLQDAVNLVPIPNGKVFQTYAPEGKANFELNIDTKKGFDLALRCTNLEGKFVHVESGGSAEVYSGSGDYSLKDGISTLDIERLQAALGPGRFTTGGTLIDFDSPKFDLALDGRMDLEELKDFLNIRYAEVLAGRLDIRGRLLGQIEGPEIDAEKLLRGVNFHGGITLENGVFKTSGRSETFEEIKGNFEIVDNAIAAKGLEAVVGSNRFSIEGKIHNALPYLVGKGEKLEITADLYSDHLDLSEFITERKGGENQTALKLPRDVAFNLAIEVGSLTYKNFLAEEVSGRAIYRNGLFTLNPVDLKLASGRFKGGVRLREAAGGFAVASRGVLEGMDVSRLFAAFDDFGQKVIAQDQIEGLLLAKVDLTCTLDSLLRIDATSVKADADVKIDNGKLKRVRSLMDIAEFIEGNAVWDAFVKTDILKKELEEVEFATLENQLSIADRRITIPEMQISTSVLDLTASGVHDFDNRIDYSVSFRLSELLQTGREADEEFGYVVDDGSGLNIFMRMTGTVDDPRFESDKAKAREKRKEKFQEEKSTFKGILKEEFGLFKSDTSLSAPPREEEKDKILFEVEWGEKDSLPDAKGKKTKRGKSLDEADDDDL
jgi:hypothetical protein